MMIMTRANYLLPVSCTIYNYIISNDRTIKNDELERMGKESNIKLS